MATNAEIAARLLRDAAGFFRTVGEQNAPLKEHMDKNAQAFEVMAERVETDPPGRGLLRSAAGRGRAGGLAPRKSPEEKPRRFAPRVNPKGR